jgi:CRISPR-associated protein Csh1
MPTDLIESSQDMGSDDKKQPSRLPGKEIWVHLDVVDPQAETLEVRGIEKIDIADFWSGNDDEMAKKRRYLYRDPVGSAAKWRFSPVYKLGAGVKDGEKKLLGEEGDWRTDKASRFFKLYDSTLKAFEERGVFSTGAVDVIMNSLVERVGELAALWTEKKASHLLILSPCDGERFLYPIEVKSYLGHFRSRLSESTQSASGPRKGGVAGLRECAICHSESQDILNLEKVFAFATFDKKSFLPGLDNSEGAKSKVFPVCDQCYKLLSEGRNILGNKFLDGKTINNVKIYIVPELLLNNTSYTGLKTASSKVKDFIHVGLKGEAYLSEKVLEHEDEIVLHFVFWEQNQAQERVLLMVEDVPPSRLKKLETLWTKSVQATSPFGTDDSNGEGDEHGSSGRSTLDQAIKSIAIATMSLSGKNKSDTGILRDLLLDIIGRLMKDEPIDVRTVKSFVVSRLQGLFSDGDWVVKYGAPNMRRLQRVMDFLHRVNLYRVSER